MGATKIRSSAAFAVAAVVLAAACTGSDDSDQGEAPTDWHEERTESVTITVSGDVLLHNSTWASAEADAAASGRDGLDFAPMFAAMQPVIDDADLAICHLETPLAPPDGPFQNYPVFSAPPQVLDGLKHTGYDLCTTASNHSDDKGFEGITRTVDAFSRHGLPLSGTAKSRGESRRIPFVDAGGAKVAVLSYTYGTNGLPVDPSWSVNLIEPDAIKRDAARASQQGAEIVAVALHHGTEYVEQPTEEQRETVDEVTRSDDIDLVYGHHAHTSQPFDVVNGTWVAYGLGNFIAQQEASLAQTYRGTTATFTFDHVRDEEWKVSKATVTPTQITRQGEYVDSMRVLGAQAALDNPDTPESLRPKLRATVEAVRKVSFSLGAGEAGLRMAQ